MENNRNYPDIQDAIIVAEESEKKQCPVNYPNNDLLHNRFSKGIVILNLQINIITTKVTIHNLPCLICISEWLQSIYIFINLEL